MSDWKPTDLRKRWIAVEVDAEDYRDLVNHFAKPHDQQRGKPLVAVHNMHGDGAFGQMLFERDLKAAREIQDTKLAARYTAACREDEGRAQ